VLVALSNHVSFEFCLPTNAIKVPAGPEWLHEIKHDGFRIRVERDGDRVRLITRGGYDWTKRYPWIAESALKNRIKQFVIDGVRSQRPAFPAGPVRSTSFDLATSAVRATTRLSNLVLPGARPFDLFILTGRR